LRLSLLAGLFVFLVSAFVRPFLGSHSRAAPWAGFKASKQTNQTKPTKTRHTKTKQSANQANGRPSNQQKLYPRESQKRTKKVSLKVEGGQKPLRNANSQRLDFLTINFLT
jgi:hypothetical protein